MDTTDPVVRDELERRLAVIGTTEAGDGVHTAFPRADLWVLVLVVLLSMVLAVVAGS